MDVEAQLRMLNLWQAQVPPPEALASAQPFSVDTLNYVQWLQFIFLPTLSRLLKSGQALPDACGIAPMAEEYFRNADTASAELERILAKIDRALGG